MHPELRGVVDSIPTPLGLFFPNSRSFQAGPGTSYWMEGLTRPGAGQAEWEEVWSAASGSSFTLGRPSLQSFFLPRQLHRETSVYQSGARAAWSQAKS